MRRVIVDGMGGDHGPGVVVAGALQAAKEYGVGITLVSQSGAVESELSRHSFDPSTVRVLSAATSIGMRDSPSRALKRKDSSMRVAFDGLKAGEGDAVVSAGNSGAMMAIGMFVMGRLPGVDRPAILTVSPSLSGGTVLLDGGANTDCKPRQLAQFAQMGAIYAERILGVPRPRVGILSNGEEDEKGNDLTREAIRELRATELHFAGHVEGRDIANGRVDVVVCDGFTGNVALKTMEGLGEFVSSVLKEAFRSNLPSRLGFLLCGRAIRRAYDRLDYAHYGGAPLIGLNGVAIVAHGGSSAKAIKNAVRVAAEAVSQDINGYIVNALDRAPQPRGQTDRPGHG